MKRISFSFSRFISEKMLGQEVASNPYLAAKLSWNSQVLRSNKTLSTWRIMALLSVLSLISLWIFYGVNSIQPKYVRYLVNIKANEDVAHTGVAKASNITVDDNKVQFYLRRFIKNYRSISPDKVALKENLLDTLYISTGQVQNKITDSIIKNEVLEKSSKGYRVDVIFLSFRRIAEKRWTVSWREQTRLNGGLLYTNNYQGTFSYFKGTISEGLPGVMNSDGFYFDEFSILQMEE